MKIQSIKTWDLLIKDQTERLRSWSQTLELPLEKDLTPVSPRNHWTCVGTLMWLIPPTSQSLSEKSTLFDHLLILPEPRLTSILSWGIQMTAFSPENSDNRHVGLLIKQDIASFARTFILLLFWGTANSQGNTTSLSEQFIFNRQTIVKTLLPPSLPLHTMQNHNLSFTWLQHRKTILFRNVLLPCSYKVWSFFFFGCRWVVRRSKMWGWRKPFFLQVLIWKQK